LPSTDEFGLVSPKDDLEDLPDALWRRKATDWIYTLRDRTHGLNNGMQALVGDVGAMRKDVDIAVKSLGELASSAKSWNESINRIEGAVGSLKWLIPIAASAVVAAGSALFAYFTRK